MLADAIHSQLNNGTRVCLRPLRRADKPRITQSLAEMSDHSRYMRFFSGVKTIPDYVVERLVDVDGTLHLAWVVLNLDSDEHVAVGAVHAIRDSPDAEIADFALGVLDAFHSEGVARMMIAALGAECLNKGIMRWTAGTLSENQKSKRLFKALGGEATGRDGAVVNYEMQVAAVMQALNGAVATRGVRDVLAQS